MLPDRVRRKDVLLFVAGFRLSPLGLQSCSLIETSLLRTNFIQQSSTRSTIERQCWRAGCTDYLAKPCHASLLQYRVNLQLLLKRHLDDLKRITLFECDNDEQYISTFARLLETQLSVSSRRSLPLSLVCFELNETKSFIENWGYGAYDVLVTRLNKILEQCSLHNHKLVVRADRDRFYCLFPEAGKESARHFIYLVFRSIFYHNTLKLNRSKFSIGVRAAAITNLCRTTHHPEMLGLIDSHFKQMEYEGIKSGMKLQTRLPGGVVRDTFTSNWDGHRL